MKMMVMMNLSYNLIFLLALLPSLASSAILGRQRREFPNQRSIKVMNMGKRRIDIFWMNTQDGSLVTQSEGGEGYAYGADTSILSYIGHRFKIVEMPGKKSQTCVHDECRFAYFTVQESEGQGKTFLTTCYHVFFLLSINIKFSILTYFALTLFVWLECRSCVK